MRKSEQMLFALLRSSLHEKEAELSFFQNTTGDHWKECYQLAYKNFNDVLSKIGLEVIPAEGQEFDPNLHEAVMQTPTDEKPENTIITELQKGYKLGDKVLRASLVNVATAP